MLTLCCEPALEVVVRCAGLSDTCKWLCPMVQAGVALTKAQVQELVAARENYMTRTRRTLQQRQALWQVVRANLLDTSLQDGCPSAESKICAFEKVLELQRNMDDYHWNFAWLMREWCLRILSPLQVCLHPASFRLGAQQAVLLEPADGHSLIPGKDKSI